MENSLTEEDWVLVFFYAGNEKSIGHPRINGILMFTKQFFVFVKEIRTELLKYFNFVPYDYGPYSFVLKDIIHKLAQEEYLNIEMVEDRQDFILTDKGLEKAKSIYANVDDNTKKTLGNLRKEANQLGYRGVLRYVYSRYPEYTTASKIKERVLNGY